MEKAYKLEFAGERTGSLYVNCCGLSQTEGGFGANTDIIAASVEAYIDCINKFKE